MPKKIVAGNWKMNKSCSEASLLFNEIKNLLKSNPAKDVTVIVFPSFVFLRDLAAQSGGMLIGAQNCASEASGAFTGEVSAAMIRSAGAEYVIIGHSERRTYFAETNSTLAKKIDMCIQNNLKPVYCIGETSEERKAGKHFSVVEQQLNEGVFHLSGELFPKIIIAYEPVWAIGTGVTATAAQAQEMHAFIRETVKKKYSESIAVNCPVLYGGSCNPTNAKELFACPDINGGLIGGASLNAADFIKIIHSF
ncbi:MAG: triose-phosphate isomerase [Bacteroidetes bacterium]|nr:triose-phosphate isomerase [Bacteroidota bacterium]